MWSSMNRRSLSCRGFTLSEYSNSICPSPRFAVRGAIVVQMRENGAVAKGAASMAMTVCILHPGEMGAEVAAAASAGGARVLWVSAGRGGATRDRAGAAGLEDAGTLKA